MAEVVENVTVSRINEPGGHDTVDRESDLGFRILSFESWSGSLHITFLLLLVPNDTDG